MGGGNIPDADGKFSKAPYFNFNDGQLKFNTNWVDNPNENYGSASGSLPKSLLSGERPPIGGLLLLSFFRGSDPPAEHPTDFV